MRHSEIKKATYVCKHAMSTAPKIGEWTPLFIEGKEYECEYETWGWEDGYRLNGSWRRYWATGEDGTHREMPRAHFRAVFHTDHEKRDLLIEGILGESPKNKAKKNEDSSK